MGGKALHGRAVILAEAQRIGQAFIYDFMDRFNTRESPQPRVLGYIGGSVRRGKAVVGDIDLVLATDPTDQEPLEWLKQQCGVVRGEFKAGSLLAEGVQIDITPVAFHQLGSALLHVTGSVAFNVRCRQAAKNRGLKLNQYGLWTEGGILVASQSERAILEELGIGWVDPKKR